MCDGYRSSKLRCSFELIFRSHTCWPLIQPYTTRRQSDRQTDRQPEDGKYMHDSYAHIIIIIITNFAHLLKTSM